MAKPDLKIITETITIHAVPTIIVFEYFNDVNTGIVKIKGNISCVMDKEDCEYLMLTKEKPVIIAPPTDLKPFGINVFYPPFEVNIVHLSADYTGANYNMTMYFYQI